MILSLLHLKPFNSSPYGQHIAQLGQAFRLSLRSFLLPALESISILQVPSLETTIPLYDLGQVTFPSGTENPRPGLRKEAGTKQSLWYIWVLMFKVRGHWPFRLTTCQSSQGECVQRSICQEDEGKKRKGKASRHRAEKGLQNPSVYMDGCLN